MNRAIHHHAPVPHAPAIFPSRAPLLGTMGKNTSLAVANTLASGKFYSFLKTRHELTGVLSGTLASIYGAYLGRGFLSRDNLQGVNFKSSVVRGTHASSRVIYEISLSHANTTTSLLIDITCPSRPAFIFIGIPSSTALFLAEASEKEMANLAESCYGNAFAETR